MERADMTEVDVTALTPDEVKTLLERASRNDAGACYTLSRYYAGGKAKNANKARKFREKAAALDHPSAIMTIASERLLSSNPHARKGAMPLFKRAAALGLPDAMSNVGNCYRKGIGCEADMGLALEWYRKAADAGSPMGMFNLGIYHRDLFEESGAPEDEKAALQWFQKAARRGLKMAQKEACHFLLDSGGDCNPEEAQEAFHWCLDEAEHGDLIAMYDLGLFYRKGIGVEKDWGKMAHWFLMSAQGGQAHSQFNIGTCYINGEGVEKDVETGIMWLEKSAAQKDLSAVKALYQIYGSPQYGRNDPKKHFHWLTRADMLGDPEAHQRLSRVMGFARRCSEEIMDKYFPGME